MVEWADGSKWSNENLEPDADRKPGGLTQADLLRREGEMVLAKWTGRYGKSQRPVFLVTNVSGRPLETRGLWTYYYAADGEQLDRESDSQVVRLDRGATIEVESGDPRPDLEAGTRHIELVVSSVKFTDGAQELWSNENLGSSERPMRAKVGP